MKLQDSAAIFLATGGYVGKIPLAPGTLGSFWGLPAAYFLSRLPVGVGILIIGVFILVAIAVSHRAADLLGQKDPGCIVIDEVAGMLVTLFAIPFNAGTAAVGFVLFRLLDIFKPFPIKALEQRLPGGAGIVLDDVVAGVMANLLLRIGFAIANLL